MTRTIVGKPGPPPVLQTLNLNGRLTLEPGREVTVKGLGRHRYTGHVNADGSVDVYGPHGCRSVMPDRITTVHRTTKLRLKP